MGRAQKNVNFASICPPACDSPCPEEFIGQGNPSVIIQLELILRSLGVRISFFSEIFYELSSLQLVRQAEKDLLFSFGDDIGNYFLQPLF